MTVGPDREYQDSQPVTSVHKPLIILADDLTGACDAAVAFTRGHEPVRVQITGDELVTASVQAIITQSRELPPADSEASIRNIAQRLPPDTELFKKIDSVFRGNTVAEIAAVLRHARFDLAVIAPAYPELGRTVSNGILHIHDGTEDRTVPIAELLAKAGCSLNAVAADLSTDELAATFRRSLNNPAAILCDASTQEHLAHIVRAARSLDIRILWIGSGGLAHAIASELTPSPSTPSINIRPGHAVFFIGSTHPMTRAQVEHLLKTHSTAMDLLIPVVLGETTDSDVRHSVATYDPSQIGCLFMTGGDTAHFVCRALGIHALRLQCEFSPGVPLAVAEGGPFDGVAVILKSGGFGDLSLLSRLLETCHPEVLT